MCGKEEAMKLPSWAMNERRNRSCRWIQENMCGKEEAMKESEQQRFGQGDRLGKCCVQQKTGRIRAQ